MATKRRTCPMVASRCTSEVRRRASVCDSVVSAEKAEPVEKKDCSERTERADMPPRLGMRCTEKKAAGDVAAAVEDSAAKCCANEGRRAEELALPPG